MIFFISILLNSAIIQYGSGSTATAVWFIQIKNNLLCSRVNLFYPVCFINFQRFIYKRRGLNWMPVKVPFSLDSRALSHQSDTLLSEKEKCHAYSQLKDGSIEFGRR